MDVGLLQLAVVQHDPEGPPGGAEQGGMPPGNVHEPLPQPKINFGKLISDTSDIFTLALGQKFFVRFLEELKTQNISSEII